MATAPELNDLPRFVDVAIHVGSNSSDGPTHPEPPHDLKTWITDEVWVGPLKDGDAHKVFIRGAPYSLNALRLDGPDKMAAESFYHLRSEILHGRDLRDLAPRDLQLYITLETLLREAVKRGIHSHTVREWFTSDDAVRQTFPV